MAGVRRANPARLLSTVERQGICGYVVTPKGPLKVSLQGRRPQAKTLRLLILAENSGEFGCTQPGGVNITLHLAEGDRPLGQSAVGVEDGIIGILPALLNQS